MFNIGAPEWIVILLILLVVVGPEQLPGLVRKSGKMIGQARSLSEGLRSELNSSMAQIEAASDPRTWADHPDEDDSDKSGDGPEGRSGGGRSDDGRNSINGDDSSRAAKATSANLDWVSTAPGPFQPSAPAKEPESATDQPDDADSSGTTADSSDPGVDARGDDDEANGHVDGDDATPAPVERADGR